MWIKLISPKMSLRPMDTELKRKMSPPLSLLVLGALTPVEHNVTLEDENVEKLKINDRPDLVGITVKADTANRSFEIADSYRNRGVPVVLGGIHPTVCPEEAAAHADAVVIGEAENTWPLLVQDAAAGKLEKIYRQGSAVHPHEIPIPRWELIAGKDYLFTNTLYISRGCPWGCSFCYNSSRNVISGHRVKPAELLLREIETLRTKHVLFIDDNFAGNPQKALELVEHIKPLNLTWHTAVSTDVLKHPKLLDAMALAGCKSLFIGFESINPSNLDLCGKIQNRVSDYDALARAIHSRGMMVNASLVFGFDEDTTDIFPATLQWLTANRIESMTAHILTPYPGTKWHAELLEQGRIIDFNYDHYNTSHVVYQPKKMTPRELYDGYINMYRGFYSWKNIIRRFPGGAEQIVPFVLFNLLYRKYGKLTAAMAGMKSLSTVGRFARRLSYRIK